MTAVEILQAIIDNNGSCDWIMKTDTGTKICRVCPIGLASPDFSCTTYVMNKTGKDDTLAEASDTAKKEANNAFLDVAARLLGNIQAEKILLGDK